MQLNEDHPLWTGECENPHSEFYHEEPNLPSSGKLKKMMCYVFGHKTKEKYKAHGVNGILIHNSTCVRCLSSVRETLEVV